MAIIYYLHLDEESREWDTLSFTGLWKQIPVKVIKYMLWRKLWIRAQPLLIYGLTSTEQAEHQRQNSKNTKEKKLPNKRNTEMVFTREKTLLTK